MRLGLGRGGMADAARALCQSSVTRGIHVFMASRCSSSLQGYTHQGPDKGLHMVLRVCQGLFMPRDDDREGGSISVLSLQTVWETRQDSQVLGTAQGWTVGLCVGPWQDR